MATNPKSSVNPLHAAYPQIFKRTGEVRRLPNSPKFSRQLAIRVDKVSPALDRAYSVTVETPVGLFVLSNAFTKMIQMEDGLFRAMLYNGWTVYPTPNDMLSLLPVTQGELPSMDGE